MTASSFGEVLARLEALMQQRKEADPEKSYVARLYSQGRNKIAQKVGEEALETVIAAVNGGHKDIVDESVDLIFHWLVLLAETGVTLDEVAAELVRREGISGIAEKQARAEG